MIDDLLDFFFEDADLGGDWSRRAQLVLRVLFGLLGAALGLGGAVYFLAMQSITDNIALALSMAAALAFLGCFWLFNVMLGRSWSWPWKGFLVSFAACFVTRFLFGA